MRKSVALVIIVSTVLAMSVGTALAENKAADKGGNKGQAQKGQAQKEQAPKAANGTTMAKSQATPKGEDKGQEQGSSYAFKGTIAQNGADGSPLEVRVEKANDAAQSTVGKNLKFNVSSDTEIYRDDADTKSSELDAKLSDLKAGDKVVIQARTPKNATGLTARLITAEASNTEAADTEAADAEDTNPSAPRQS